MSDISIPEVSMTPKVTQSSYTVERVHKNHRGEYVSNWTNYVTTVYDHKGRIITTHCSSNKKDILV